MPSVTCRMNEFMVQDKTSIGPPRRVQERGVEVDHLNLLRSQHVWTRATDPTRDSMAPNRALPKHPKRNRTKEVKVVSVPDRHRLHAFEHLVLKDPKQSGLVFIWAQETTSQDHR